MTITLSPEQTAAIYSIKPTICILACAGSGKTTTITKRIAKLINEGKINPTTLAAITFTVLAANKLKLEIAKCVNDKSACSQMFIGTIHSFCFHILTEGKVIASEAFEPITESQQFVLLNKYWNSWELYKINNSISKSKTIERLIATFDIIKINQIDPAVLHKEHNEIYAAYMAYNDYLTEYGYLDFADMLVKLSNCLSNKQFAGTISDKYNYIFIDEYQDVDMVQAHIVNTLNKFSNTCVVGDDDQAIYQFRGTDEKNIQDFANNKNCTVFRLSENRRSPENILKVAENCILKVKTRLSKSMTSTNSSGLVNIHRFDHIDDEVLYIAKEIETLFDTKQIDNYGQVAILLRSVSSYGKVYIDGLNKYDIPCFAVGAKGLFDTRELKNIMCVLEWLAKENPSLDVLTLLDPLLSKPFDKNIFKVDELGLINKHDFVKEGYNCSDYELLIELYQLQDRYFRRKFANLLQLIHGLFSLLNMFSPSEKHLAKLNLGYFTQIVADYEKIEDDKSFRTLYNYLRAYAQKSFDEKSTPDRNNDAVNLLTVHQAKGLEYDHVFIPMLVDKRFPLENKSSTWLIKDELFNANRYKTTIDNERRLFYVALTRARKSCYLLSSKDVGLVNNKKESIFLKEASSVTFNSPNSLPNRKNIALTKVDNLITSYSALEYYLTCPYRYYLNIELGIQFPQLVFFQFGKLIHDILAKINYSYIQGIAYSLSDAKQYIEESFTNYYKNTNLREYDIRSQKLRAHKIVDTYYKDKHGWLTSAVLAEKDFTCITDRALIRGRFDVIIDNNRDCKTIIDYKTGKMHNKLSAEFQMKFYTYTAITQLNIPVKEAILYYIEEDKPVVFKANTSFIGDTAQRLSELIEGIIKKNFHPTPSKDICMNCEGNKICSYKV